MLWTAGRVARLKGRAGEAQARIRDLVVNGLITGSPTGYAWGQFLDEASQSTQYGIYGTSACIQILVAADYPASQPVIRGASEILDSVLRDEHNPSRQDGDISVVYKVAYLAEAIQPDQHEIRLESPPMDELVRRALPGGGWGEYFYSPDDHDPHPRVVATAAALLALRRYRQFRVTEECEKGLCWLARRVVGNGRFRPHEFALASLTLFEYRGLNLPANSECGTAIDTCRQRLVRWAISRRREDMGTSEAYCYSVQWEGRRVNRYLFFLPDCLVALALLRLGCPKRARAYILKVCDYFGTQILERGGFQPITTGRKSSVDHLWIYRLLQQLRSTDTKELSVIPRWLSLSLVVFLGVVLLGLSILGFYWVYGIEETAYRVAGGVLASISLGLLVRLLWTPRGGEEDKGQR